MVSKCVMKPSFDLFKELDQLDPSSSPDEPFGITLQHRFANVPEEERGWARSFVEGFHAADPSRISTDSIIAGDHAEQETDGHRGFHIAGGYRRLVESLCNDLAPMVEVRTASVVTRRRMGPRPGHRRSKTELRKTFQVNARQVVVALPLGVLQRKPRDPGAVVFNPSLVEKEEALRKLSMGSVVRLTLQFDSCFGRMAPTWATKPFQTCIFFLHATRSSRPFGQRCPCAYPCWWLGRRDHQPPRRRVGRSSAWRKKPCTP